MKPETIDTITRHLKGIVAALEKERTPTVTMCNGKPLEKCSDEELVDACKTIVLGYNLNTPFIPYPLLNELSKRNLKIDFSLRRK